LQNGEKYLDNPVFSVGGTLHRLADSKARLAPPIDAPMALRHNQGFVANVGRNDDLGTPTLRDDSESSAVVVMLRGLKMYGMVSAVGDHDRTWGSHVDAAETFVSQLLTAELT
jgi:hypothetical protein